MGTIVPPLQDAVQHICTECGCTDDRHLPSCPQRPLSSRPDKRIVFIATEGPCAGMHQICGVATATEVPRLSSFVDTVIFPDGHTAGASKIKEDFRAVYYRELILPTSVKQTLAAGDKHGHFNPHQE